MNILFATTTIEPFVTGGAQSHTFHLALQLKAAGDDIWVARWDVEDDPAENGDFEDEHGINHVVLNKSVLNNVNKEKIIDNWCTSIIKKLRPDIIHLVKLSFLAHSFARVGKHYGIPVVMTGLGFPFCPMGSLLRRDGSICDGKMQISRCLSCVALGSIGADQTILKKTGKLWLQLGKLLRLVGISSPRIDQILSTPFIVSNWQYLCSLTSAVIAPSLAVERSFIENGMAIEKVHRIPYGLPEDFIERRKIKKNYGPLRIAYLGKISQYKGVHVLIKAAMNAAENGASFELAIFGELNTSANNYHKTIRSMVEEYQWPTNVEIRFCGRYKQNDLPEIHNKIDVAIVPSLWVENATIVVLESLALGTPVIASDVDGISEFIQDGVNGFLFPHGEYKCLANLLIKYSREKKTLRMMESNCNMVITFKQMIPKVQKIYQDLTIQAK